MLIKRIKLRNRSLDFWRFVFWNEQEILMSILKRTNFKKERVLLSRQISKTFDFSFQFSLPISNPFLASNATPQLQIRNTCPKLQALIVTPHLPNHIYIPPPHILHTRLLQRTPPLCRFPLCNKSTSEFSIGFVFFHARFCCCHAEGSDLEMISFARDGVG